MSKDLDFILPGFPGNDLPETIIVTEETKKAFYLAKPVDDRTDVADEKNRRKRGQGMVGGVWLGKDQDGKEVAFCDGVPAFNKNDGRKQEN